MSKAKKPHSEMKPLKAWAVVEDGRGLDIDAIFFSKTEAVEWWEGEGARVVPVVISTECNAVIAAPELLEALDSLIDEQNGPPLFTRETQWNEAMKQARFDAWLEAIQPAEEQE